MRTFPASASSFSSSARSSLLGGEKGAPIRKPNLPSPPSTTLYSELQSQPEDLQSGSGLFSFLYLLLPKKEEKVAN